MEPTAQADLAPAPFLQLDEADVDLLPGIVAEIAMLVGLKDALRLVEAFGGVRIYVPTADRLTPEHWLCDLVGLENAKKLAREFGGQPHFDIPRCAKAMREVRNRGIRRRRGMGASIRELALAYRMTEKQIGNILGDEVESYEQLSLW